MPLVRVTGVDADAFDISHVARMNDHSQSRTAWHSRRASNNNHPKSLSTIDTDETPSTDSSTVVHSDRDGGVGRPQSFAPEGTTNNNNRSYNIAATAVNNNNLDNYYDDPFNPFDTQKIIPEEDEDLSSTAMDDCSLSGTISSSHRGPQQQQNSGFRRTNSQRSHSSVSTSSLKNHASSFQQRNQQIQSTFYEEEEDDNMSSSSSIQTSSMRNRDSSIMSHSSSTYLTQLVSQLESQVAKLNFELATTKSSLDEIQLENRKLHDEKAGWRKKIRSLEEENDQLRLKMERMERDKLMRTMESTKGKARGRNSMDVGSCVVWGGSTVSGNTWAEHRGDNTNTITSFKQELKQVSLDESFSNAERYKSHTYMHALRSSFTSTGSYRSFDDLDKSFGTVGSVNLNTSNEIANDDELEEEDLKPSRPSLLGSLRPIKRLQEMNKRVTSAPSQRKNDDDSSTLCNSITSEYATKDVMKERNDHSDEEYDEDDPFSTWSENRERSTNKKKKWFQLGDGQKQSQNEDIAEEEDESSSAKTGCVEEDPFDTTRGEKKESEYTSFAADGDHSDNDSGSANQQPRRGGFRLPWQRGNEGR